MTCRTGLAVCLAGLLFAVHARGAAAVSKTWTGSNGLWTDDSNWEPAGEPEAGDDVIIASGNAELGTDTAIGGLTLSGGALSGSGTLMVNGAVIWSAGMMSGSGTTVATVGMDLGGSSKTLNQRTLVLSGGTASMHASGSFISMRNGATFINQATLEFSNDGGLTNNQGFFNGGSGSGAFINHGILRKLTAGNSGVTRFAAVAVDNTGTVEVLAGSLSFSGGYTQTAGVTRLNGGAVVSETALTINSGTLTGSGMVEASVSSEGEIAPGLSPGALQVSGTHTQMSGAQFTVEIGGVAAGTQFDQLNVAGAATLAGALDVHLIDGFVPALGQRFEVMTFASRLGTFDTMSGLDLGGGLALEPQYGATNLVLAVVAAPPGTPTAMPASPTPTATPDGTACVGDCDGSHMVRIGELIVAVNIALGQDTLATCRAIDANGDDAVGVNELITAVNAALGGCA